MAKEPTLKVSKKRNHWCPMEAYTLKDVNVLNKYPYIAMPKLDGVRAIIKDGVAISKKGNLIRNRKIKHLLENELPKGWEFEGEMMCYDVETNETFRFKDIHSVTSSFNPEREYRFQYHIWDLILHEPFDMRLKQLKRLEDELPSWATLVPFEIINNKEEANAYKERMIKYSPEGIILRTHNAEYKYGRSTGKEQTFVKWKCREESDAIIVGSYEYILNLAESENNNIGFAKKQYKKAMLQGGNILGGFFCKSPDFPKEFRVGTGFDLQERVEYWENKDNMLGLTISFEHEGENGEGLPKNPSFKGIRRD